MRVFERVRVFERLKYEWIRERERERERERKRERETEREKERIRASHCDRHIKINGKNCCEKKWYIER